MKTAVGVLLAGCVIMAAAACQPPVRQGVLRARESNCASVNNPGFERKWVGSEGDTLKIQGNSSHQLVVNPGTVPVDSHYLYVVSEVGGPGNGCTVVAAKVSPGSINDASGAYTLRIRCRIPSAQERCDAKVHTVVERVEDSGNTTWLPAQVSPDTQFVSASSPGLSAFALGTASLGTAVREF